MILRCATKNAGKLREFRAAQRDDIRIEPLPQLHDIPPPDETSDTFEGNASQKAVYYSTFTDDYLFVDDSGLSVDALGGEPGVYSARYAGPDADDEANNRLLLERMKDTGRRSARFVCVIALARHGRLVRTFRSETAGSIAREARGTHGFGYDPLFVYPPFGRTFGELEAELKQTVSHRGKALRLLLEYVAALRDRAAEASEPA